MLQEFHKESVVPLITREKILYDSILKIMKDVIDINNKIYFEDVKRFRRLATEVYSEMYNEKHPHKFDEKEEYLDWDEFA